MMNIDKKTVQQFIENLIQKGLEKSCTSLAFFLKEHVELDVVTFYTNQEEMGIKSSLFDKDIVLYSEIKGQLTGMSYFKMDKKEADFLFQKNVPATKDVTPEKTFFDGFLLELDNIITASVVTELANTLHIKTYGGVPHIAYSEDFDKMTVFKHEHETLSLINFTCTYKIKNSEFHPVFLWMISHEIEELAINEIRRVQPI